MKVQGLRYTVHGSKKPMADSILPPWTLHLIPIFIMKAAVYSQNNGFVIEDTPMPEGGP